jgi:hypothetical protein
MCNINIAIRLSSLSAEIRKVLQPQENGREFLVKSPVRDSLVNNIPLALTLNPSPKGRGTLNLAPFSLWEKGWG